MKYHPPLVKAVIETLKNIFENNYKADKAVEKTLKQEVRWGSRDRRFIAETTYEMVRWWRLINECNTQVNSTTIHDKYMNLFAIWQLIKGNDLPEWEEFKNINKDAVNEIVVKLKSTRKIRESIPDWLEEIGVKELGETSWETEIAELNKEAQVVLRVNTLKISAEKLKQSLAKKDIVLNVIQEENEIWDSVKLNALVLEKRQNLEQLDEYKKGFFEIQDASSQLIAPFLMVSEGMTVIDACAGAGGKSLHIAALIKNKGKIIAMDVEDFKLKTLQKRAERAGASIIKTKLIQAETIELLKNSADRLLLDVPCSGLGVLKRNPDSKWKLNPDFLQNVRKTQQEIISNYSKMLKSGGLMVYATCSILPSENQLQVKEFLEKNIDAFELVNESIVLPSFGFDGFYMAAIKKH